MTDWTRLRDAYGSAEGIPDLLEQAATTDQDVGGIWDELWSRLCHQGTVYSASHAAIPHLAQLCTTTAPKGYLPALQLASSILTSVDTPEDPAAVRERHRTAVAQLREVAVMALPLAADDVEFIYGLEAVASFEDLGVWQRTLNYLANGEAPLQCTSCDEDLLLDIDENPPRVLGWDADDGSRPVVPAQPPAGSPEARLIALATQHHRDAVAEKLRFYVGTSACPACGSTFSIAESFA